MPTLAAFEQLPRFSFNGYEFPVRGWRVRGGIRKKLHEYPHAPGAATEKLGRKPYEFELDAIFDTTIRQYPNLWPNTLATLRVFWEGEGTYPLVVPTIGTVDAYADDWEEVASSKRLSGVDVKIRLVEDTTNDFLIDKLIQVSARSATTLAGALLIEAEDEGLPTDFFSAIKGFADQILAVGDQIDAQADLIASKADGIASLCEAADTQLTELTDPKHFRVGESLRNVWSAAVKLNKDVLQKAVPIRSYTLAVPMGVSEVAGALYGDASRAVEIMKRNPIDDPLRIAAGTVLQVATK